MAQHKVIDRLAAAQKKGAANLAEKAKAAAEAAAEKARKQQNKAQKAVSATPVPTARQNQSRGSYYSPRQYGADSAPLNARAEAARKAMEEQAKALEQSRRAMEELYRQAREARESYHSLRGQFVGENAGQYEQKLLDQYTEATELYVEGKAEYDRVYGAYKPYEDAYNRAARELNDYLAAEEREYQAWRGTIRDAESIRAEQQELKQKRAELKRLMWENNRLNDPGQPSSGAVTAATVAGNEARIRELQEYLGAVGERERLLEEELEYSEYYRFEDLRQNGDFAQRSRYDASVTDWDYDWVNNPDSAKNIGRAENDRYNIIPHMNADEVAMYNYLYAAQGTKAAKEYLRYLEPVVNQRRAEETEGLQREFARQHPVAASGISVLVSPMSGVSSAMGMIAEKVTGQEIDPNSGWYSVTNGKNTFRDEVGAVVEENWGPVGSVGYSIGMSMLDMLADKWTGIGLAGGGSGSGMAIKGLMGSRAVAETVIDGKNRGLSDEQAIKLGLVSGAAELITEGIGLDEMLKLPKGMEDAGFWRGALKGFVGEAGEEGLTNLANLAADISIAGDKSEFARSIEQYKAEGKDDAAALEAALKDEGISLGLDMLGGGISGVVFGGVDGWRSKRAADGAAKKENAADGAAEEATPSVSEAAAEGELPKGQERPPWGAPTQSAGEPLGKTVGDAAGVVDSKMEKTTLVAGGPEENSAAETVSAQEVQEDVQKGTELPEAEPVNGGNDNEETGERVLHRGPERADAAGAGEQTDSYAEIRERQQTEARSQAEAAAQRRVKAENLEKRGHLRRVSAQDLGLRQGTEVQELLELPRIEWDQELYDTATRLEKETGMTVRTVTGNIGVRLKGGGVGLAKGYIDRVNKTVVVNVCHSQVTAGQIADHELWHHKMEAVGRISGDRYEVTRLAAQRIQEQYSPEDFDEVLDAYIDGYGDVYDQSNWEEFLNRVYEEIMADAYAGINAFGVEASRFRSTVDSTMDELGMGRNMWNAAEQEDTPAPGGDQRVYSDEDAPPMPEDEDYSQVPEYDWDGWDDSMADFSLEGFSERIDEVIAGKYERKNAVLVGATPKILGDIGLNPSLPMLTTQRHLLDAMRPKNKQRHTHGLTRGQMNQLPEKIRNPVMVMDSLDRKSNCVIVVTDMIDPDGLPIIAIIRADGKGVYNGVEIDTNFVNSYYGRNNFAGFVKRAVADDAILYVNKEKATTLSAGSSTQWLEQLKGYDFDTIIRKTRAIVKGRDEVRFSLDVVDSEGRGLSAEQQAFFKDSKVRDEDGRLMVMYHGTPSGKHTTFRSGTYFTPNREYADVYQKPGASMLSSKKDASAPKTYEVYLNITKPFDTRNPRERKIFMEEYYRQWGTGAPLSDSGLPDWTDGMDLQEFIEEMGYDYDGLILDEGATGGYGLEVKSRGLSYVTFSSEQVKDVENRNPTDDPDIRFSMDGTIQETDSEGRELSAEQQAFFKDSKVRDEDGRLMVMYHGTSNGGHTVFDTYGKARYGLFGKGSYFTDNPGVAQTYTSKGRGDRKQVYNVYLNITNPMDMGAQFDASAWAAALPDVVFPQGGTNEECYRAMERYFEDEGYTRWEAAEAAVETIESMGYDGITHIGGGRVKADGVRHRVYIAFYPEQVKDVGNQNPTDDPDIRFSMDESLSREEYERLAAEVAGDQSKRNEEFVKSKLTPEQYKQYKAFAREDRLDQEAEARVRGIERLEEAQAREDLAALRAQQAEDAAAGRRELAAEETAARDEAREKAGTARQERKRKAQEKREQLRQEARERIRRAAENAPADSVPTIARKELQDKLIGLFSVGEGQRGELRREIGQLADRMIAEGTVDERDLRRLIDRLYESGVMVIEPEEVYAEGRNYLKDEHIYISPEQIREWGDDWPTLRKKAWGLGVYLVTDRRYAGLDVWNAELASYLPGLFDENETDDRTILNRILQIAEEGKAEKVSLPEYTKRIARAEHQSEEALLYNMERQVEEALRTFGEKASLEMRLKNRNARRRAMDREEAAIAREADRAELKRKRQELADDREALRELNEAERDRLRLQRAENDRRNAAERRRLAEERAARRRKHQEAVRKKELRELQEKTLKALQWISKNRRKAPEAMQEAFNAVLGNIDLYAISMADEMRWSSKYGATWKDLKQMYNHARTTDPNFIPSEDLQRIVDRLDSVQLESMDFDQLRDLYQAAVGLRTEFYNRNNVIGSEEYEIMGELYNACVGEMRTAPKKLKGMLDRFLNLEQLTPMNVFEEMGGFNPDGALYKFAQQLEAGERKVRSFKVRSNKLLADFLEDNADWIHRADGQGKDGIWIEVEIPQLIGMKVGEVPEFGGTVKVFMTPMQRVHLYLESRNYDNLRHMTGGRTFADRELYSQGKREEAFAKGATIRMAPETVQLLVKDMSPEELELARLLDIYYNDLAATEINKVSNILLGYNKAMGGHYAPIFTDKNYTESEFGRYDCTAEGAGNLKERNHYSKVPSYNISALDAFERNMDRTATYVGMAIPSRNWATLMKWKAGDSSFKAEIDHTWGPERKKYIETLITDLQNPMGEQQDMVTEMSGKLLSNYISSVFGFNPSIVVKQLGSIPMASAYLDWKHFPKGVIGKGKIDRELIGRYTQELDWRTMGYSMPETKQLKDAPNWSQKNKAVGLVFGGDAITAMDGWAASVLWPWAENKVRAEFPGLEVGDAAMIESGQSPFYQKVAELFNDAVSRSQSVSDQMHQGRLRKSKHAAAKAFTMFRSDSAQSYNVLRQKLGELDYYRRQGEGGKVMVEAMKKTVGAAATAVLINGIWGTAVDLLVKALKGKLDEEDKEPLQIAEDFFWGVIDSYAGMVITGDIIAEVVGGWFTGEKAYSTEAPGIEQFNDIKEAADKIINAGKKGNLIGAIKIGAETIATYGFGLPAKNVEAYLMGLFSWALPGAKVAYEDLLKAPAKADLKGLEGDALAVRLNHVLKGYGVELEPDVREALAGLYEAGYTEAVPSAAPDAVTVDGVELELDGRMKKEYDKTRGGIIEQELPEITGSAFFAQADEKTRKAMVTKLYNYAAEKAKEAVLEDYAIGTTAMAIDEIVRAGGSAADYAVFDAVTADMAAWQRAEVLQEWGTDEAVTGLMFKHLVSKSWEDEQAELRKVGVDVGQFLELYAMHGEIDSRDLKAGQKATEFAYWLDGQRYTDQQKAAIKDQMAYFQMMPADASRYNAATAAGLDREQALELTEELDALEPPEGKTSVQEIQKYRVAIDQSVSESNQLRMLQSVGLKDSSYDKVAKGYEMGVAPAAWVRVKEVQQQFDANGNGSMTGAEWEAAIEGICAYGIVLPGDNTRFNLTNEQKGVLWQMLVGKNTKSKNNPFDPAAGQRWRELMGYE